MRPIVNTLTGVANGPVILLDHYLNPFEVTLHVDVTGVVTYSVQYTNDDVFAAGYNPATGNWTTIASLNAQTAEGEATLISPVTAVRCINTAGAGSTTFRVTQSGIA